MESANFMEATLRKPGRKRTPFPAAYGIWKRTPRATCDCLDHSPLVGQITFATSGTTVMTATKGYDCLNRLTHPASLGGTGSPRSQFDNQYNPAGQRPSVTNPDGSYWVYGYDSMGQVTSGKKYWSDGTPVAGQQFDYAFDDIGNRQTTARDLRQASYSVNSLNQYTSRSVPGFVNVLGTATGTATVSLWSKDNLALYTPTTRQGDYFRGEMLVNNNTGALWLTITNVAALSNYTGADIVTNIAGSLLLAQNPETFIYDADGNLIRDGLWDYTWDAENRLVKQESLSGAPTASKLKLEFQYDSQGRRMQKLVSTNNGSVYVAQCTNRFVYDGWNLLASLNPASSVRQAYLWGLDLSGTMQGAGGVGGLLVITDVSQGSHFCAYDGNGNVTALVKADGAGLTAQYEYGPFGELLRATGPMAKANPFRFSTKYQDDETDLLYYGYRYYDPSTGRWLNRDPIEEFSFRDRYSQSLTPKERFLLRQRRPAGNEFVFVDNHPVNSVDPYGLTTWIGECEIYGVSVVLGVLFIDCYLTSACEIGPDKHSESVFVRAVFFQAEVGLPVNYTISGNTFVSPPALTTRPSTVGQMPTGLVGQLALSGLISAR